MEYALDGLDGLGEPVDRCTAFGARVSFDRVGEIHIIQADVEKRGSLELVRLNGPGAPDATVYWDDTGLDGSKVRGNAPDQLDGTAGVDSTGGVHGWGGGAAWVSNGWGDARWIDDWAYLPTDEIVGTHSFVDTATCGPLPETGSVTVRVVDEDTLDPVPGAVVTLVSTTVPNRTFTATTGADGTVAFEDVPAGDYEIRTGPPVGYLTPPTASITAVAGDDVEATVPLARLTTAGTPDSSLTFDGDPELLDGGIPVFGPFEPVSFSVRGCESGAPAGFTVMRLGDPTVLRSGTLTEVGPGEYRGLVDGLGVGGALVVRVELSCSPDPIEALVYVDPAGAVVDRYCTPVEGATVHLDRSLAAGGPYTELVTGDPDLDPTTPVAPWSPRRAAPSSG